jgi:uncharacterized protein YihD (DUF1040 family)
MRDPNRIDDVLAEIKKIWSKNPDLRLGQLFCNVYRGRLQGILYYDEDDEILFNLKRYYNKSGKDSNK